MHSQKSLVSPCSDQYIYTPNSTEKKLYLYPTCIGHFSYEPGYFIRPHQSGSFLIMHITRGTCQVKTDLLNRTARTGEFVLLDCYAPHQYGSLEAWDATSMHFDGILARNYYNEITQRFGQVFTPLRPEGCALRLNNIYQAFLNPHTLLASVLSSEITDLLNLILGIPLRPMSDSHHASIVSDAISYINEHFHEDISVDILANLTSTSTYHFIRIFSKETGYTPYQYLMNTRIHMAKYLLRSPGFSIKDIAIRTGFRSESSFCACFKKAENITPGQYRKQILA